MYELAWAMKLRGVSPLAKLIAILLADHFSEVTVPLSRIIEFTNAEKEEIDGAISELVALGATVEVLGNDLSFVLPVAPQPMPGRAGPDRAPLHLYVMSWGELTKVGVAKDLVSRRTTLEAHLPAPVKLEWFAIGEAYLIRRAERDVHKALRAHHHHGEWFSCDVETAIECAREKSSSFGERAK